MNRIRLSALALILFLLAGCAPERLIDPTETITVTPIPSPTIIWFPPTNTLTPIPAFVAPPTLNPLPGMGAVIFRDDFSDASDWSLANSSANTIIIERNRLTLAANNSPMSLFTLRNTSLTNFHAEVKVNVNRCEGNDSFGMLFRNQGQYESYRVALDCSGQVRLDRLHGSTYPLQNWLPSGDAPLGAPAEVLLGVWVSGREIRITLNGNYQFSAFDTVFSGGTIGFFVDAKSAAGMNISFSDLVVRDVSYLSPTPTFTPSSTPKPTRTKSP